MNNQNLEAKKLEILQEQLKVHRAQDKRAGLLLQFAMVLTGLLYFMFEKHLFLGDAVTWAEYFTTWHGAADFVLTFIIVVMSAIFLAWVKHHAYLHFGLYGSIGLIVVTVIGFALFAEFFSQSASQDTKSRVLLANDKAYQATIAQPSAAPTQFIGGSSTEIAKAEQVYARCMANLGKPGYSHCNGDKAKLDSLKAQESTRLSIAADVAIQSNVEMEKIRNERQDKLKADSYNPVIVSIAKFLAAVFGGDYTDYIKTATVLVTLIVAIAFEILHHFLSHAKERAQNAVYGLELELAKYQGLALPEKPESVIPRNDGGFKESGIGFTAPVGNKPATAKYGDSESQKASTGRADIVTTAPLFKYQEKPQEPVKKQSFGFIPDRVVTTSKLAPDTATLRESGGFRQSPEQLQRVREMAADATGKTYRQSLRNGFTGWQDGALDAPVTPPSSASGTVTTEPLEQTVYTVLEQSGTDSEEDAGTPADRAALEQHNDLYPLWLEAVKSRVIPTTARACRDFVAKHRGMDVLSMRQAKFIWNEWGKRAVGDTVLILNPEYAQGNRKLKYILS